MHRVVESDVVTVMCGAQQLTSACPYRERERAGPFDVVGPAPAGAAGMIARSAAPVKRFGMFSAARPACGIADGPASAVVVDWLSGAHDYRSLNQKDAFHGKACTT